ncbi:MAG: hypothetical protein J6K45_06420 [Clostridia bacterium]|nr:hypothetical protein [Clostridia bacterium]
MKKICVSPECTKRCKRHITNNEVEEGKTYVMDNFFRGCKKSEKNKT